MQNINKIPITKRLLTILFQELMAYPSLFIRSDLYSNKAWIQTFLIDSIWIKLCNGNDDLFNKYLPNT